MDDLLSLLPSYAESVREERIATRWRPWRHRWRTNGSFTGSLGIAYSESPMWNVEERFEKKAMDSLAALGFTVGSTRGVVRVEKYGCGAEFRQDPDGRFRMTVLPTIMLNGQFTRLWDAGYQKFLLTDEGVKI